MNHWYVILVLTVALIKTANLDTISSSVHQHQVESIETDCSKFSVLGFRRTANAITIAAIIRCGHRVLVWKLESSRRNKF